jgi:hypothetical protein
VAWWCAVRTGRLATWLGGTGVAGVFLADALRSIRQTNSTCEPLDAIYPDAGIAIGIADWLTSPLTGHTQPTNKMAWQGGCRLDRRRLVPLDGQSPSHTADRRRQTIVIYSARGSKHGAYLPVH